MAIIQSVMASMAFGPSALPDPGGWWDYVDNVADNLLLWNIYDNYHFDSTDLSAMSLTQPASGGSPNLGTGVDNRTHTFTGYVYIATTGTYIFRTVSDDGSYLWLGTTAWAGQYTINNALINNGGLHGSQTVDSARINLVGGKWYPIRILFGNLDGNTELSVAYSSDNGANFNNPTWAYNTGTAEGFN